MAGAAAFGDEDAAEKALEVEGEIEAAGGEGAGLAAPGEEAGDGVHAAELAARERDNGGEVGVAVEQGGPFRVHDPVEAGGGVCQLERMDGGEGVDDIAERAGLDDEDVAGHGDGVAGGHGAGGKRVSGLLRGGWRGLRAGRRRGFCPGCG